MTRTLKALAAIAGLIAAGLLFCLVMIAIMCLAQAAGIPL